jgi:HD-GYP domain-containing protein (c-di-GMP phosphodiesterase class II)
MLLVCRALSHEQLMMAYQHHERVDGCGYPVGVLGVEIHPWAKMLAVADRFQALTTGRCGRRVMPLPEALAQLARDADDYLDSEMTQCWIKSLTAK